VPLGWNRIVDQTALLKDFSDIWSTALVVGLVNAAGV
jgi:hypothetical protein